MRIGCLGLLVTILVVAFLFQLMANSARSLLVVLPVAAGLWLFLYLKNREEEDEWD